MTNIKKTLKNAGIWCLVATIISVLSLISNIYLVDFVHFAYYFFSNLLTFEKIFDMINIMGVWKMPVFLRFFIFLLHFGVCL